MADPISLLTFGLTAGSSLMQFGATRQAGAQEQYEAEQEAKLEETAAIQREADRKQRLSQALASQIASSGARNIVAFEGSPLAVMQEDINREKVATERDVFGAKLGAMTKRARGSSAKRAADYSAFGGLIGDTVRLAERF